MAKKFFVGLALLLFFPIFLHAQAVSPVTPKRSVAFLRRIFFLRADGLRSKTSPMDRAFTAISIIVSGAMWALALKAKHVFENFLTNSDTGKGIALQNFLGGPRVTYRIGRRLMPYGKFLFGGTRFHYPTFISSQYYTYTTYAIGGGLDYQLTNHISIRPVDFEYQHLDFPPTGLTPWVYSAGVSYRLF